MPHMEPMPFESVVEDIQERFLHYKKTRGFTPNSIQTMVRRPGIVRAFMELNQAVLYEGTVSDCYPKKSSIKHTNAFGTAL